MRQTEGWIKLHRKLKDSSLWTAESFTKGQAWVDLIMMAQFKDKKLLIGNKMEPVPRGSFVISEVKLSERWKWSRGKVRGFLTMLVNEGMIDKNKTGNYTAITIVNYGLYQDEQPEKRQPIEQRIDSRLNSELTTKRQPVDSQLNTKEERKKEKKERRKEGKNNNKASPSPPPVSYFPNDEKLDEAFREFVEFRKKIRKPLATERAVTLATTKLKKLSTANGVMDNDLAVEIINQSIERCWQGLFPIKDDRERASPGQNKSGVDWDELMRQAEEHDRVREEMENDRKGSD